MAWLKPGNLLVTGYALRAAHTPPWCRRNPHSCHRWWWWCRRCHPRPACHTTHTTRSLCQQQL